MKLLLAIPMVLLLGSGASAHQYRIGEIEIQHPAILVPRPHMDCSCAHMRVVNHGSEFAFFLGARIAAASRTHLILAASGGHGIEMPASVPIPPGAAIDFGRDHWCLFMSGIHTPLEADMGAVDGELLFEGLPTMKIEFMIDARPSLPANNP